MTKFRFYVRKMPHNFEKILCKMRFTLLMVFICGFSAMASSQKVALQVQNATLKVALNQLKNQAGVRMLFDADKADKVACADCRLENVELREALDRLLEGTSWGYQEIDGVYVVRELPPMAQAVRVSGKVVDEGGQPLPGVSVVLKGTTTGVATDVNGEFILMVPKAEGAVLVFSFVGMKTQELPVTADRPMHVVMVADSEQMEEVVVTGYQTISKERATGAYAIIDTKVLEQKPTANLSEALNGLVPGLAVQSSSVDGDLRFIIRGKGTLQDDQVDSDPLIVVDGFPISGYSDSNDPFSTINPNDVESVTVLKDAAATSIYGARAANGVIVITTKKGKAGNKLDITADAYWSVSSRPDLDYLFNMASAENQFRLVELINTYEPINLPGSYDPYLTPSARRTYYSAPYAMLFELNRGNMTQDEYNAERQRLVDIADQGLWKDDLQEYIFRRMMHQQYNVALRGATERLNYSFSASFDDEKSYLQDNRNQRVLLNLSSSARLAKNLTFDLAINTAFEKEWANGTEITEIQEWLSPWTRLIDDEGNYVHVPTSSTVYEPILMSEYAGKTPADWTYNPVQDREYTEDIAKTLNYRIQGGFNYGTSWGLNLSAKGQYEQRRYTRHVSYDPESFFVRDLYNTYSTLNAETGLYTSYFPSGGVFSDEGNTYEAYNLRGQADYNKTFGAHALSVLLGTEIISATTEIIPIVTRYGFNEYTNSVLTTPDYITYQDDIFGIWSRLPFEALGSLSTMEDRFFSVYANAAYTYNERYSLTASFRTDASNFQAEEVRKKFSPFWSVGASWLISHEDFMSQVDWVNQLKLRASYGIAGVAAGKSGTSSVTTVAVYPGDIVYTNNESFNTISARGNSTLTWEKSRTLNIGMDVALFRNKLNGSIDFYNKYSYDVLSNATVPAISQGTNRAVSNNATVLNRGVELSFSTDISIAGDLRWNGRLNYAFNHNEVKKFNLQTSYPGLNPSYVEGYPVDLINVLRLVGYTPEGLVIVQGKDGTQDIITNKDSSHCTEQILRNEGETIDDNNWVYYLGTSTPKSNLSFSNMFTWKGVTFSFMLTGRFDYYVNRGDLFNPMFTDLASYSKQLDRMFQIYDEGYASQVSYNGLPLYTDESYKVLSGSSGYGYTSNSNLSSSFAYIKGDHIRLNEVYLGYDLPERLLAKQGIFNRIHIYARANNLGLIWSANGEMDPDYTIGNLKPMPTFMFGLKLAFKNW